MTINSSLPFFDKTWTLFLDRDGVINERPLKDYVRNIDGFRWIEGALEAIVKLSGTFGRIVVVTNQQGVGLGWMTGEELENIHQYMCSQVEQAGGRIDAVLSCTTLKNAPDNCRKPSIWMAQQALKLFPEIVFEKSLMVGDTESDILFGKNAGMLTVMVGDEHTAVHPDFRCHSLAKFAFEFLPKR